VDAALGFGFRHALHAVAAGLELQPRIGAVAGQPADDFAVAAELGFAGRQNLDLPALALGVARIHAEEVAGEQRRLVAAGAGADFEQRCARRWGPWAAAASAARFRVRAGAPWQRRFPLRRSRAFRDRPHRLGFGQIVFGLAEGVELDGHRLDLGAFARQLAELLHVVGRIGRRQHAVDFVETIDQQLKFLADARFHGIGPAVEWVQGAKF
jgi:hypothetical protein